MHLTLQFRKKDRIKLILILLLLLSSSSGYKFYKDASKGVSVQ